MSIRILGNQPEPSLTEKGFEITQFELRTRDEKLFAIGKTIVNEYVAKNSELEQCQLFISDPMTVGIYPQYNEGLAFNKIVLELEALGFYGKAAGYREVA